jgi:hypothetical protein
LWVVVRYGMSVVQLLDVMELWVVWVKGVVFGLQ